MAPSSTSTQFIEASLSCTGTFALSYSDPDQKWIIRKHLLSLLQEFPSFSPVSDTFNHNDGATPNLLYVSGDLRLSSSLPPVPLKIWLHENYPLMPPLVFVLTDSETLIRRDHPFVDSSGVVSTPYLQMWQHPPSNLTSLVQNLVNLFSRDHPFHYLSAPASSLGHPYNVSRKEALDRLLGTLHYDMNALNAEFGSEIEELSELQAEIAKRADAVNRAEAELEREWKGLKDKVMGMREKADVLINWIRVNDSPGLGEEEDTEEAFEGGDDRSRMVIDCWSAYWGIEDLMSAMEKVVEEGVVNGETYMKQVRSLAREQFYQRAQLSKYTAFPRNG